MNNNLNRRPSPAKSSLTEPPGSHDRTMHPIYKPAKSQYRFCKLFSKNATKATNGFNSLPSIKSILHASFHSLLAITVCLSMLRCSMFAPYVWVDDATEHGEADARYRIRPGDELKVHIWGQEALSSETIVRRDGRITLELAGDVHVAGLTTEDAALAVTHRLEGLVNHPNVTIAAKEGTETKIYVMGEVRNAGEQALHPGDNIMMVIARAGGLTEFADASAIYLLREASPQQRIRFSYSDLAKGKGKGLRFPLRHGDIIIVE